MKLKLPAPNRIAVYLTALAGLLTAVAPAVANLNTTSTVGLATGFAGIVVIAFKWLTGWQAHEARLPISANAIREAVGPKPKVAPKP